MRYLTLIAVALILLSCSPKDKVGKALSGWQEGWFEIHSINTGRGESFFYILPDGTTVLIDAAGANPMDEELESHGYPLAPARPSSDITSGQVIADYLQHYLPDVSEGRLNYAVVTHFHGDHMGVISEGMPVHPDGGFILAGMTEVGSIIPIDVIIDRGNVGNRPSKNYFNVATRSRYDNYIKFLNWSSVKNGTKRVTALAGCLDQIAMVHSSSDHDDFYIRTISSNGNVWNGEEGGGFTSNLPSDEELMAIGSGKGAVPENVLSVSMHFKYGPFDWFAGGDCQYSGRNKFDYYDIETPISKVMAKVEGMKANHHATKLTNSTELLSVLQPDFVIAGTWKDIHPNPSTVERFYNASPDVQFYATNTTEGAKAILEEHGIDWTKFAGLQGHVVVKVAPGGKEYRILVLDDSDQEYRVKSISETFKSAE